MAILMLMVVEAVLIVVAMHLYHVQKVAAAVPPAEPPVAK